MRTQSPDAVRPVSRLRGPHAFIALVCVFAVHGCGSGPASPDTPADATVTISATGVTPKEVHIKAWGHVQFVNNDAKPHQITSDPVQIHTDCPGVNEVGVLGTGGSGQTGALNLVRTCGYHDHIDEFNPLYQGRIIVE
ncbi:MAG TPA: hypothetical protein VGI12_00030 [Vicinamibacterales bacterium]|jgi:plastocyanin